MSPMKYGTKILMTRGQSGIPSGCPGTLRMVKGTFLDMEVDCSKTRVMLDQDDPLESSGWRTCGDCFWMDSDRVKEDTIHDPIYEAIEVAYNHGYKPISGTNEYNEIFQVLGRSPTLEEASLLGEARSEGFQKRIKERSYRRV